MKTLFLLRHAKSSKTDPTLEDHERPLNQRGFNEAPRMGLLLAGLDCRPDCCLCSSAKRAHSTATLVVEQFGDVAAIEPRRELYHAAPSGYVDVLRSVADSAQCVLVVGHNPGLEELLTELTGEEKTLPTAALAQVELPIEHWADLTLPAQGTLKNLWRPKDLK